MFSDSTNSIYKFLTHGKQNRDHHKVSLRELLMDVYPENSYMGTSLLNVAYVVL